MNRAEDAVTSAQPDKPDQSRANLQKRDTMLSTDRVVGLVVAAAAGDALGWPQEDRSQIVGGDQARDVRPRPSYRSWERNAGTQYARYLDPVRAGEYSDDTQLLLAVARACRHSDWFGWLTEVELPFWPIYQRGGGGSVVSASRSWADGSPPWSPLSPKSLDKVAKYFDAGANGVAMRIAPHVIVTAIDSDEDELVRRVILDGLATHGHPRALVGGAIHAVALRHALRHEGTMEYGELLNYIRSCSSWRNPMLFQDLLDGEWSDAHSRLARGDTRQPPTVLWERTCHEVDELLDVALSGLTLGATTNDQRTLDQLGVFDRRQRGSGTVTAIAAAYIAARTASRPVGGLLRSGFLRNADTDTLCSMTGSLLGAIHGTGWLSELFAGVQDRDYLIATARSLASSETREGTGHDSSPARPRRVTTAQTRKWVKAIFDGSPIDTIPDGRLAVLQRLEPLRTRTKQHVARAVLRTDDGQSLVVDRVSKTPIPALKRRPLDPAGQQPRSESNISRGDIAEDPSGRPNKTISGRKGAGQEPAIVGVEIRVSDPVSTASFFESVFQLPTSPTANDRISVGHVMVLAPRTPSTADAPPAPVVVTLRVPSLAAVRVRAEAFEGATVQWSDTHEQLWLLEPGGIRVRVVSAESGGTAPHSRRV